MEETVTGMPCQSHDLTLGHWQLSHMTRWDSNLDSGERQLSVSGNTLDHTATRTGPYNDGVHIFKEICIELYILTMYKTLQAWTKSGNLLSLTVLGGFGLLHILKSLS